MTDAHPAPPGDAALAPPGDGGPPTPVGRAWILAGAVGALALVPLTLLGPGTDLDVGAVLRSGRGILDGTYAPSRNPGAPVHEAATGVLHALGGTVGPNLGSLAAAAALTVLLALLLRREGVGRVGLSVAVVAANPWFLIAATSTVDFLWALALWVGAALVLRARPTVAGAAGAGILAGLAVGARASTALLVVGLVVAQALDRWAAPAGRERGEQARKTGPAMRPPARGQEGTAPPGPAEAMDPSPSGSPSHSPKVTAPSAPVAGALVRALVTGAVATAVGLALFVPAFLSADASLAFAQNDVPTSSPLVQVGRFLAKNLSFAGPAAVVVLLLALPALARAALRWRADWLVRLGLLTVVLSQLLFLRFPWKMGHLLPALVGAALLLARALDDRPRLLAALVAAQLLSAAVNVQIVAPDTPNAATGGRLTWAPTWGALVIDVRCRADDPDAWEGPGDTRLAVVWDCAKPWAR